MLGTWKRRTRRVHPVNTGDRDLHRVLVITREVQAQMHRASRGLRGKYALSVRIRLRVDS